MNRDHNLKSTTTEHFDLCIIGGGASGAGCALDATLRGLKVALIEQDDFAAGTSSKSTKMIHGGVRYLEQAFKNLDFAQLRQVKHGLEERAVVLANAPHLARPLMLLTPVFSAAEGLYFAAGLSLYDRFASRNDDLPLSRWLSKEEALALMPALNQKVHSAVLYYDGQLDDARYCLALAQSAAEAGATVVNHFSLNNFEHDATGRLVAAETCDTLSGEKYRLKARVFLNCTGAYTDAVRRLANPDLPARVHPSKGVHAVLPAEVLQSEAALLIPKTSDGRVLFAIPFGGRTLLGTTDSEYADIGKEPVLSAEEFAFLVDGLNPYLENPVTKSDLKAGFGGLRPLLAGPGGNGTKSLLRDHEVEHDPVSNLFSLLGGKWTTYRLMAQDAIDAVAQQLQPPHSCRTRQYKLAGSEQYTAESWVMVQAQSGLSEAICRHLTALYGTRAALVAGLAGATPSLARPLMKGKPFLQAEVVYAARYEMACSVRDVLARRLRIEITDWAAAAALAGAVAGLLGEELHWTAEKITREADAYRKLTAFWQREAGANTSQDLL